MAAFRHLQQQPKVQQVQYWHPLAILKIKQESEIRNS
jgi:hypothetical protein